MFVFDLLCWREEKKKSNSAFPGAVEVAQWRRENGGGWGDAPPLQDKGLHNLGECKSRGCFLVLYKPDLISRGQALGISLQYHVCSGRAADTNLSRTEPPDCSTDKPLRPHGTSSRRCSHSGGCLYSHHCTVFLPTSQLGFNICKIWPKSTLATEERKKKNTFKSQNLECNGSNVGFSLNMFL